MIACLSDCVASHILVDFYCELVCFEGSRAMLTHISAFIISLQCNLYNARPCINIVNVL